MLCTRCQKRVAVIFVQKIENGKPVREGLCLQCAKELGFNPAKDLMRGFPGTEEEMQQMNEQLSEMLAELSSSEDFSEGGAPSLNFMENFMGGQGLNGESAPEQPRKRKRIKSKKAVKMKSPSLNSFLNIARILLKKQETVSLII